MVLSIFFQLKKVCFEISCQCYIKVKFVKGLKNIMFLADIESWIEATDLQDLIHKIYLRFTQQSHWFVILKILLNRDSHVYVEPNMVIVVS